MPADPVAAGRKGGAANTPAQQAARKRNGFQKRAPMQEQPQDLQPGCGCLTQDPAAQISQPKEGN